MFCGIVIFMIYASSKENAPPPPPELSREEKDILVIELLKGMDMAEAAKQKGIDESELKKWREEFLSDLLYYAKHRRQIEIELAEKTAEIKWFEDICEEYIGEDWKEKTEYDMRNR